MAALFTTILSSDYTFELSSLNGKVAFAGENALEGVVISDTIPIVEPLFYPQVIRMQIDNTLYPNEMVADSTA